jgi:CheY-like chemotaxis protein
MFSCLLIDDNWSVLDNHQYIFQAYFADKVRVLAMAKNAQKGLELIALHDPDVLFLDAHMPNIGGSSVVSYLYKNRIYKGIEPIKIILYTGKTEVYESISGSEFKYPVRILDKGTLTIEAYGKLIDDIHQWIVNDRMAKTLRIDNQLVYAGDIVYLKSIAPVTEIRINNRTLPLISGYPLAHYKARIDIQSTGRQPLPSYFFFATNDFILNRLYIDSYAAEEVFLKTEPVQIVHISRTHRAAFEAWWFDH